MSYILDALKKSDRERQRGRAPGLNSIHEPYNPSPEDRSNRQQVKYIFTAIGIILLISIPIITWYSMKDFTNPAPSVKIKETTATNTKPEKDLLSSTPSTEPLKDNDRTSPPPPCDGTTSPRPDFLRFDRRRGERSVRHTSGWVWQQENALLIVEPAPLHVTRRRVLPVAAGGAE